MCLVILSRFPLAFVCFFNFYSHLVGLLSRISELHLFRTHLAHVVDVSSHLSTLLDSGMLAQQYVFHFISLILRDN